MRTRLNIGLVGRARLRALTRFAIHCKSEAAAGRKENSTYWRPGTASLITVNSPVRLLADLVNFERLGSRPVELIAGVS